MSDYIYRIVEIIVNTRNCQVFLYLVVVHKNFHVRIIPTCSRVILPTDPVPLLLSILLILMFPFLFLFRLLPGTSPDDYSRTTTITIILTTCTN